MTQILIALICSLIGCVLLLKYTTHIYNILAEFVGIFAPILLMVTLTGLLIYSFLGFDWFAAEHKVKLINDEYNTTYTQEQIFWASDVIDIIREIKRERIEVNGNLMREQ